MLSGPDTSYHFRRGSPPPGSPLSSTRRCCFYPISANNNQTMPSEAHHQQPFFCCCCYTSSSHSSATILATIGVCCLVLAYTALGAFIFMTLEGDDHNSTVTRNMGVEMAASTTTTNGHDLESKAETVESLRSDTVDRLWSITENLNILYRENWTRLAADEVLVFQKALFRTLRAPAPVDFNGSGDHGSSSNKTHKWSFGSSFLYSLTLITTIGYGSVSPRTTLGKLVTILYALVGIPLMLLYLSSTGDLLARFLRRLYSKLCGLGATSNSKKQQAKDPPTCPCGSIITSPSTRVPITLCLVIILSYIAAGAILFQRLENWSLLEGSYFCFTSLGTIGFGDLVPGRHSIGTTSTCVCSGYILVGMALVAMCFSLVQDDVIQILRSLGATCSRPVDVGLAKEVEVS